MTEAYDGPSDCAELCGWQSMPQEAAKYQQSLTIPRYSQTPGYAAKVGERRDVQAWRWLRQVHPRWRRGRQLNGSCVAWGAEGVGTTLLAKQAVAGISQWIAEVATEPLYGGMRADLHGRLGGWSDGATGSWAAKWAHQFGLLLRLDYSAETGNAEHDLRVYSGKKEKDWGNYGCGGQRDALGTGPLDKVAKRYPVQDVTLVETTDEAAAALQNGHLLTIASSIGFGQMRRDSSGVVRRSGSWMHQMCILGLRWVDDRPQFRIFNSWGDSAGGPDPGVDWDAVSACSWWATTEDTAAILRQGDSYAFSDVQGFPAVELDWGRVLG